MNFEISAKVRRMAGALRRFVDEEVVPLEPLALSRGFGAARPELDRLRAKARALRLFAPHLPKEWGGAGLALS
ncbi:MAG TPA: acyl-CoA dehydrogenase, partial [Thermoanaerobaculia bacterium]|nr:acyl-CoA dehydrogenase [Thermoanaerobaculia bacterium]